jgi:hypothetical protein
VSRREFREGAMWTRRTSLRSGVSSRVSRVSVPPARPRGIPGHVFVRVCVYFYVYFFTEASKPCFLRDQKEKVACVRVMMWECGYRMSGSVAVGGCAWVVAPVATQSYHQTCPCNGCLVGQCSNLTCDIIAGIICCKLRTIRYDMP